MALINIKGYSLNNERNAVYKQLEKPHSSLTTDYLPLTGNFRDSIDIVIEVSPSKTILDLAARCSSYKNKF